jgi:hypothetical protein
MLALSIRQPWAELILRGIKTVEYRSRPTRIIGRRFHIYAAGKWPPARKSAASIAGLEPAMNIWSRDLVMAGGGPPRWMLDMMAELLAKRDLPTGVLVGSAVIERVSEVGPRLFRWHLADVERADLLRKPLRHPQPAWFEPFAEN